MWARVVGVETRGLDHLVLVEAQRRGACGGCSARATCGVGLLDRWLSRRARVFRALDPTAQSRVGDLVGLSVSERVLAGAALVVYVLPLLGLFAGALWGAHWTAGREVGAIVGGLAGFALTLVVVRRFGQSNGRFAYALPVVVRRQPAGREASAPQRVGPSAPDDAVSGP